MNRALRTTFLSALVAIPFLSGAQMLPNTPHLDFRHRTAFLLLDPSMEARMKLAGRAGAAIHDIWLDYGKRQASLGSAKPNDKRWAKLDQEVSEQVLKALSPSQQDALLRAAVEVTGPSLLNEAPIQTALGLSVTQITTIEQILKKAAAPTVKLEKIISKQVLAATNDQDRAQIQQDYAAERRRLAELRKKDESKALGVLSAAQRKKFTSGAF